MGTIQEAHDARKLIRVRDELTYKLRVLSYLDQPSQRKEGAVLRDLTPPCMVDGEGNNDLSDRILNDIRIRREMREDGLVDEGIRSLKGLPLHITDAGRAFLKAHRNVFVDGALTDAWVAERKAEIGGRWAQKVTRPRPTALEKITQYLEGLPEFDGASRERIDEVGAGLAQRLKPTPPNKSQDAQSQR